MRSTSTSPQPPGSSIGRSRPGAAKPGPGSVTCARTPVSVARSSISSKMGISTIRSSAGARSSRRWACAASWSTCTSPARPPDRRGSPRTLSREALTGTDVPTGRRVGAVADGRRVRLAAVRRRFHGWNLETIATLQTPPARRTAPRPTALRPLREPRRGASRPFAVCAYATTSSGAARGGGAGRRAC